MASPPWRSKRFAGGKDRLRPAVIDPLEEVGLPSKGDKKLLSYALQEDYFRKIRERCEKVKSDQTPSNDATGLENALSALQIQQTIYSKDLRRDAILMAMRKLREGIIASARTDAFAVDVYKFIIRTAISWQAFEAYQPAIRYLLYRLHPEISLSSADLEEFVSFYVLDLACRLAEYGLAYQARLEWRLANTVVHDVLNSLVRSDWPSFWRCKASAGGLQSCLITLAESRVRSNAVQCLMRTYFTVDNNFVKLCTGKSAQDLLHQRSVDWNIDGDKVTLRKPKAR